MNNICVSQTNSERFHCQKSMIKMKKIKVDVGVKYDVRGDDEPMTFLRRLN